MDEFNPNPALHLTNGKKVRLPIDAKFRDTTTDFTFPSSSIREKVARKIFYKLSLPAELVAFESIPAVAVLVTLSALSTEDDYSKVVAILNSRLQLKTIYGNFVIVCACVSYEKRWAFIVAQVPRTYSLPQQRILDLAAAVLSKYTGITLPESNPNMCALTGTITDSRFTEFDIVSQGDNDILTLVHCGRFYNCLAQKSQEDHAGKELTTPAQVESAGKSSLDKDALCTAHLNFQDRGSVSSKDNGEVLPCTSGLLRVYEKVDEIPLELLSYAAFQLADGDPSRIVYFNSYPVSILYIRNATINEPLERFYCNLNQWPLCVGAFAEVDNYPISEFKDRSSYKYLDQNSRLRSISSSQGQGAYARRNSRNHKEETILMQQDLAQRGVAAGIGRQQSLSHMNPLTQTQRLRLESRGRVYVVLFLKRLADYHSDLVKDAHRYLIKSGHLLASSTHPTFLSCTIDFTGDFREVYLNVGGITDNSCIKVIESLLLSKNCRDVKINITLGTVSFLAVPSVVPIITNKIKALGFTCKMIIGADVADEANSLLINISHIRKWIIQFCINLFFLFLTTLFSFGYKFFPKTSRINNRLNTSFITISDTLSMIFAVFCVFTNSGYLILKYGIITLYNRAFSNESMLAFILIIGLIVSINAFAWSLKLEQTSRIPLMFDSLVILITMVSLCKIIELKAKQLSAKPYIDLAHSIPSETVIITELLMPEVAKYFFKDANNLLELNMQEDTELDTDLGIYADINAPDCVACTSGEAETSPQPQSDLEILPKKPSTGILSTPSSDSLPAALDFSEREISRRSKKKQPSTPQSPRSGKRVKGASNFHKPFLDDSLYGIHAHSNEASIVSVGLSQQRHPLYNILIKTYQINKVVEHLTGNYNESFAKYKFANVQTRTLTKGTIVRVQAGYRCPCDGIVVYGSTEVDERYISGRRMMTAVKNMGDVIYAGTQVLHNDLYVCCVMINQDTVIGRIFGLLQRSQKANDQLPKVHKLAYRILDISGPLILGFGVILFITWLIISFTSEAAYNSIIQVFALDTTANIAPNLMKVIFSCYVMLAFFIAGCSSALAIAFPIISLSGSTKAQKMGLVMRNCCLLSEQLASVEYIVFSKSGTLTFAQPTVESILIPFNIDAMLTFFEATGQLVRTANGYIVKRPTKKDPETINTVVEEPSTACLSIPEPASFVIASSETANTICTVTAIPQTTEDLVNPYPSDNDTPGPPLSMFAHPGQERRMSATTIDALNAVVAVGDLGAIDLVTPREEDKGDRMETFIDGENGLTQIKTFPFRSPSTTSSVLQLSDGDVNTESTHRLSSPATLLTHITSPGPSSFTIPPSTHFRSRSMLLQPSASMPHFSTATDDQARIYTKEELCANMDIDPILVRMRDKFIYSVAIKCLKYYGSFAHHSGNPIIYSLLTCIVLFAKGKPINHVVRNISNLSDFALPEVKDFEVHQDRGGFSATMDGEEIYCGNFYHEKKDLEASMLRDEDDKSNVDLERQLYVKISPQTFKYEFINVTSPDQLEKQFDNHDYAALYIRGELISTITVSDTIRPDSLGTTMHLRKSGYNVHMITADTKHSSLKVAEKVGIPKDCVIYDLPVNVKPDAIRFLALHDRWPTQKEIATLFRDLNSEEWHKKQQRILFVCDGINDISCLPACGVSVAVGSGEQILKNSADVVLLSNRLSDTLQMFRFAGTVRKFMIATFVISILYSVIVLILSSGVLMPILFIISPTYSALAITGLVLIVIALGLSLNLYNEKR